MKFFVDTANLSQICKAHELGNPDGATTNSSLMEKDGIAKLIEDSGKMEI